MKPLIRDIQKTDQDLKQAAEQALIRAMACLKSLLEVRTRSTISEVDGVLTGTLFAPNYGEWTYDDSTDSLNLSDSSRQRLKEIIAQVNDMSYNRWRIMCNDYLNDDQKGVMIVMEQQTSVSSANVSQPVPQSFSVEIQKSRYGNWGSVKLVTKTITVKAVSFERALAKARAHLITDPRYKTKQDGADSIGWSLVADTKSLAPKEPTIVRHNIC